MNDPRQGTTASMEPQRPWAPLLRAASLTGAATVAGAAMSMTATKIFAAMLGPANMAVLATLQQIRQAGVTGAALNGQTALVQGLSARRGRERREFLRTALILIGAAAVLVATLLIGAPGWVAAATGLGRSAQRVGMIRWMAAPVSLSCALVVSSAALNALRAMGGLALVQVAGPAALAILAYPVARAVARGNEGSLVWWLAASAACAAILAVALLRREGAENWADGAQCGTVWSGAWWSGQAARAFLSVSGSMLASSATASLILLAARARILEQQGFAVAGQFDAAWAISMNHVSLMLGSLQTYCLPELARSSCRAEHSAHLRRVLKASALVSAAVVCALALVKTPVLALLYSDAFRGAARYLRWTLVGDYLKASSWVLSIPMLAAADMRLFLGADLAAYVVFAAGSAVLGFFYGAAEGTAMAFVLMYAAHLATCGWIASRRYAFRPGVSLVSIWAAGFLAVTAISALTWRAA